MSTIKRIAPTRIQLVVAFAFAGAALSNSESRGQSGFASPPPTYSPPPPQAFTPPQAPTFPDMYSSPVELARQEFDRMNGQAQHQSSYEHAMRIHQHMHMLQEDLRRRQMNSSSMPQTFTAFGAFDGATTGNASAIEQAKAINRRIGRQARAEGRRLTEAELLENRRRYRAARMISRSR